MKRLTNAARKYRTLAIASVIRGVFHMPLGHGTRAVRLLTSGRCLCAHLAHAWPSARSAVLWDSSICADSALVDGYNTYT